jgi:hypothetical protein
MRFFVVLTLLVCIWASATAISDKVRFLEPSQRGRGKRSAGPDQRINCRE